MANPWDSLPDASPLDVALAAEGASAPVAAVARSVYQQESSSGKNTKTSNRGAVGGMQVIPSTFQSVAGNDLTDINDPVQNARAGVRYLQTLEPHADGDPAVLAAGYYGGLGGLNKAKQGVAASDPENPNAPNTLQYGAQVASRIPAGTPQASAGNPWDSLPSVDPSQIPGAAQAAPQAPQATTPPATPQQPAPAAQGASQAAPQAPPQAAPAQGGGLMSSIGSFLNDPVAAGQRAGEATRQGIINLGTKFANDPLGTADGYVRGVADFFTGGYADKAAAKANSAIDGSDYNANVAAERAKDAAAGPAFTAGQLTGALIPGIGEISLASKAAELVPTASKAVRVLAGAGAGGVEGAVNYMGHNDSDTTDPLALAASAGLGAAGGSLIPLTTGATTAQKVASYVRANGGAAAADTPLLSEVGNWITGSGDAQQMANAARSADVDTALAARANNVTQNGAAMTAPDANAVRDLYTQNAANAVRQMAPSPQRTVLLNALNRPRGLKDADIAALRTSPEGNAVADAVQMHQQTQALTAPTPASNNPLLKLGRMVVDNGGLGMLTPHSALLGAVTDLAPVRNTIGRLLGGRATRESAIANRIGQSDGAQAFINTNGASAATQSAADLQNMGQQALASRQGLVAAQQQQRQAQVAARQAAAQQQAAAQIGPQITGAQWQAGQQRQAAQIGPQISPMQRQAYAQQQAQQQAAQAAQQATQAAAAKEALKTASDQREALAVQWSKDPSNVIGMSNPLGVPHNDDQMAAFSKTLRSQMEARQAAAQLQAEQAAAAKAQLAAASQPSPQELQKATRMPAGGGFQTLLDGGESGLNLAPEQAHTALRSLSNHPVLGPVANEMRQTGGVQNPNQFYALTNAVGNLKRAGALGPVAQSAAPAASTAISNAIRDPQRWQSAAVSRQQVQKAALAGAQHASPEVQKLVADLATTTDVKGAVPHAAREALFNKFMSDAPVDQQVEAFRLAKPMVSYK